MRDDKPYEKPFSPHPSDIEISDETYHELRELSIQLVEETILGKAKDMAPVLFVHYRRVNEDGMYGDLEHAIVVVADGFQDTESKYKTVFSLGKRFEQERMIPAAIFMGNEAWLSHNPQPGLMPRDDPERKECIVIAGRSIGGECKSLTMIPISHDADGFIIRSGEDEKHPEAAEMKTPLLDQFFIGFFSDAKERYEQRNKR